MLTENLSTLKIHKLTQTQYNRELELGNIDENALYLTPDEEIDLSAYAPSGYGLGTHAVLVDYRDIDTLTKNGWYKFDQSLSPVQINNHGIAYGRILVLAHDDNAVTQWLYDGSIQGHIFQRVRMNGIWGAWAAVNPRMAENVEHLTTERYGDKPVYTKLINCGAVANGMSVSGGSNITIIRQSGLLSNCALPYGSKGDEWYAYTSAVDGNIYLYCSSNFADGTYNWYHQIWYYYKED